MSRAQTMDVINDTTTIQSRIDTVLATSDSGYDWSPEIEWWPGDPLYTRPNNLNQMFGIVQRSWVRPMFEVLDDDLPWIRCESCEVSWTGNEPCFICGAEDDIYKGFDPVRIFSNRLGQINSIENRQGLYGSFTIDFELEPF